MNIKENRMLMKNGIYLKKKIKNIVVGDSSYYYNKRNKILIKDTVNKAFKSKDKSNIDEINCIDKLKAIKGIKKERIPYGIPTLEVGDTLSIVSLEQLAKEVKFKYSDALPTLLLKKFKITREKTKLSENIVF